MSLQVFLEAQLLGAGEFLARQASGQANNDRELAGCCAWLNLLCELLPRALLTELRLSPMLLGSSSAEQFLLVLTEEDIPRANEFLTEVSRGVRDLSGGTLRLVWATTENLGPWPLARERLDDALSSQISAPLANVADLKGYFVPFLESNTDAAPAYFAEFARELHIASRVGWSRERPAHLTWDGGQYSWALRESSAEEGILFPRRFALDETGAPASLPELAARAEGTPRWGILKGNVDHFEAQLKRAGTIEEHLQLSALFKEFFAGELSVACSLGDLWRKVSILYRGGDDFAVIGSWDALLTLARDLERVFEKLVEQHLQMLPGLDAKTISMSLAIAPEIDTPVAEVLENASKQLHQAKAIEPGTFHLFGRVVEWKRLGEAEELKNSLIRLARDFGYSPDYIHDLAAIYREAFAARDNRRKTVRVDKPWRMYMRLSEVIPQSRARETAGLRNQVILSLIGKRTAALKLRPAARVGLEWARMATGGVQ